MQVTSPLYQSIISGPHSIEVKLDIAGTEYGMDRLMNLRTMKAMLGEQKPTLGLAVSGEIDVTVIESTDNVPRMAQMTVYVRVVNRNNTASEWIKKGVYYIDTRQEMSDQLKIHGYDILAKAEVPYSDSALAWPSRDVLVMEEIANSVGMEIDSRTYDLMTQSFTVQLPQQYVTDGNSDVGDYFTKRETLAGIAGLYGGSFIINDLGKLQLVCPWNRPVETYFLVDEYGDYLVVGGQRVYIGG